VDVEDVAHIEDMDLIEDIGVVQDTTVDLIITIDIIIMVDLITMIVIIDPMYTFILYITHINHLVLRTICVGYLDILLFKFRI